MDFNLRLLNLFVGLLKGDASLPTDLLQLGYHCVAIEPRFDNGAGGIVNPEILASSSLEGHSVLFEWKAGGNVDEGQARRYSNVTVDSLVSNVGLRAEECLAHDIAYAVPDDMATKSSTALTQMGFDFVVLAASSDALRLDSGSFGSERLTSVFQKGLACGLDNAPLGYVPCWPDSADSVLAEACTPHIVAAMSENAHHIEIGDIGSRVFPVWSEMHQTLRTLVVKKVYSLFKASSRAEFGEFIGVDVHNGARRIVIKANPFHDFGRERADALRRLQRAQLSLLRRLIEDERHPEQLALNVEGD